MNYIDIRDADTEDVKRIKFDNDNSNAHASFLSKSIYGILLEDGDECGESRIRPEAAGNLIKALQKAIELGWMSAE